MIYDAKIIGKTQADGAQSIVLYRHGRIHSIQVRVYTTATGANTTPSAGTLAVAARIEDSCNFEAVTGSPIDLVSGPRLKVFEAPGLTALQVTPTSLDASCSYDVYITSME